jgi:hypothetical protein
MRESRQAERAHQFARGVGGLFAYDVGVIPGTERPTIAYGGASALSTDDEPRYEIDLKPLADNWRILALAERASGFNIGIEARSLAAQAGPGVAAIEFLYFLDDYARALRGGDLDEIIAQGVRAVSALRVATELTAAGDGMVRVNSEALAVYSREELLAKSETKEALYRIPADVLIYARLRGVWSLALVDQVRDACSRAFGPDDRWMAPLFEVAAGRGMAGTQAPLPIWAAEAAAINEETVHDDPGIRFKRDLLVVLHAGASAARQLLEPLIVDAMGSGWEFVLQCQRFRLSTPGNHAPTVEAARLSMNSLGLRGAAALLLAADPAVRYGLNAYLIDALRKIARLSSE